MNNQKIELTQASLIEYKKIAPYLDHRKRMEHLRPLVNATIDRIGQLERNNQKASREFYDFFVELEILYRYEFMQGISKNVLDSYNKAGWCKKIAMASLIKFFNFIITRKSASAQKAFQKKL